MVLIILFKILILIIIYCYFQRNYKKFRKIIK
uniref:Uncharacterized protein n=1 Tax=viral metagenome TaxID=1070528 RepID=A0A6C0H838_9ZZZZ